MTQMENEQVKEVLTAAVMFKKITAETKNRILYLISQDEQRGCPPPKRKLLRPREIASQLGCCKSYVYKLMNTGALEKIRINEKIVGTTEDELNRFLRERSNWEQ